MRFKELELMQPLLKAVEKAGYTRPSPIQQKAIPPVLQGRDLLGCAQTGTGKTAAFALPILQRLSGEAGGEKRRPIRALVLTPTRELALQIYESFTTYGEYLPLRTAVIFGGVGQAPQVAQLKRGIDILVATPGRLNDLIGQGYVKLDSINVFVLDEADRMLDMGFVQDVKKVMKVLPKVRQTLLFSATMPDEIVQLAKSLLNNPAKVFVTPASTTVEAITQRLYKVDKTNKRHLLAQLLGAEDVSSALVFTRTKHGADRVVRELKKAGVQALAIHGNKSQGARQNALGLFKEGKIKVLVATDIAARGLDISELSHVFNYDLPNIPETYVHRIGRTGRAGRGGIAISFCSFEELPYLKDIEKLIGFAIPEVTEHDWPMKVFSLPEKQDRQGKTAESQSKQKRQKEQPKVQNKEEKQDGGQDDLARKRKPSKTGAQQPAAEAKPAGQARGRGPGKGRPPKGQQQNEYENRTGGNAIITKRPVWASQDSGAAAAPAPQRQASDAAAHKGEEDMSRNNRRRRGKKRPAGTEEKPGQEAQTKLPKIPKNDHGVFDFSEEELAQDTSLRLISNDAPSGEAKYASFEDYLKDH